ncbi:ribosomal protein S18-alanine N-acetyltransferase [Nocardioides jishulii]|uniref:[Ribosomal protein bS18]-alanine N-acetyltransferase n=1 Tax=Nocardioides jishulii TaxID=2575440 RepID=A0A4V5TKR6_9ACTN|nr:ribosomal protein S18-alanine N-acetyltransferase [Nocardioides jishulii]QCX28364.1 ribosomal-protein-alanine N-acetyltransferase [Nocardioides jishulii]TKI64743.1 ribosomal-protein-alanine N-acetyltransferase [Nocardioides jishulii]
MTLRPGHDEDLPALAALEEEAFGADAWSAATLGELVSAAGRRLLVAERDGEVVGYVLTALAGDFADLLRIAVAASARREGVASMLVDAAVLAAAADGADRMLLEVSEANAGAQAFYRRRGFTEIDRRPGYYRDGSAALVMLRELPAPERMDP